MFLSFFYTRYGFLLHISIFTLLSVTMLSTLLRFASTKTNDLINKIWQIFFNYVIKQNNSSYWIRKIQMAELSLTWIVRCLFSLVVEALLPSLRHPWSYHAFFCRRLHVWTLNILRSQTTLLSLPIVIKDRVRWKTKRIAAYSYPKYTILVHNINAFR